MIKNSLFLFLLTFLTFGASFAQKGSIVGKIEDANTQETVIGAIVKALEANKAVEADFDGNYTIENLNPGTYTIQIELIGYETKTISNVSVTSNQATTIDVKMGELQWCFG